MSQTNDRKPAPVIAYHEPTTPSPESRLQMRRALELHEGWLMLRCQAFLLIGVPLSFLGPFLIVMVLAGIDARAGLRLPISTYWLIFLAASLAIVPWIYWREHHGGQESVVDALRDSWYGGRASSRGEFELRSTMLQWTILFAVLLYGPRMVYRALADVKNIRRLRGASRERSAMVLEQLAERDEATPLVDLRVGDEPLDTLRQSILYLLLYEWIDLSKDRKRAWLTGRTRQRFFGPT